MRKLIITGMAVAMLAIPAVASADVAVDKGVGYVGKGDVQSKLGFNDAAMQSAVTDGTVKFTANVENIVDYKNRCYGSSEFGHTVITQPVKYEVAAVARTNKAGKFVDGWDFNGKLGTPISAGQASFKTIDCPEGSFSMGPIGVTQYSNGITGDLKVNDIALPNTPVAVPVA